MPLIKGTNLIYRASKDGWAPKDFHKLCDGKGPTVCLVRSSKGMIAGGFTNVSWSSPDEVHHCLDKGAILFSVSN